MMDNKYKKAVILSLKAITYGVHRICFERVDSATLENSIEDAYSAQNDFLDSIDSK